MLGLERLPREAVLLAREPSTDLWASGCWQSSAVAPLAAEGWRCQLTASAIDNQRECPGLKTRIFSIWAMTHACWRYRPEGAAEGRSVCRCRGCPCRAPGIAAADAGEWRSSGQAVEHHSSSDCWCKQEVLGGVEGEPTAEQITESSTVNSARQNSFPSESWRQRLKCKIGPSDN